MEPKKYKQLYKCVGYTSYKSGNSVLYACKPEERTWIAQTDFYTGKVSHGMCKKCGEAAHKDLEDMVREMTKGLKDEHS